MIFSYPQECQILHLAPLLPPAPCPLSPPLLPLPLLLPPLVRGCEGWAHHLPTLLFDHRTVVLTNHPRREEAQERTTMTGGREINDLFLTGDTCRYLECSYAPVYWGEQADYEFSLFCF